MRATYAHLGMSLHSQSTSSQGKISTSDWRKRSAAGYEDSLLLPKLSHVIFGSQRADPNAFIDGSKLSFFVAARKAIKRSLSGVQVALTASGNLKVSGAEPPGESFRSQERCSGISSIQAFMKAKSDEAIMSWLRENVDLELIFQWVLDSGKTSWTLEFHFSLDILPLSWLSSDDLQCSLH